MLTPRRVFLNSTAFSCPSLKLSRPKTPNATRTGKEVREKRPASPAPPASPASLPNEREVPEPSLASVDSHQLGQAPDEQQAPDPRDGLKTLRTELEAAAKAPAAQPPGRRGFWWCEGLKGGGDLRETTSQLC